MKLIDRTVADFTQELASPAPVPGGGGASALAAAIGISLGDMVGELTVGKKRYADVEEDIRGLMERSQALRLRFLELVDGDSPTRAAARSCARQLCRRPPSMFSSIRSQ